MGKPQRTAHTVYGLGRIIGGLCPCDGGSSQEGLNFFTSRCPCHCRSAQLHHPYKPSIPTNQAFLPGLGLTLPLTISPRMTGITLPCPMEARERITLLWKDYQHGPYQRRGRDIMLKDLHCLKISLERYWWGRGGEICGDGEISPGICRG